MIRLNIKYLVFILYLIAFLLKRVLESLHSVIDPVLTFLELGLYNRCRWQTQKKNSTAITTDLVVSSFSRNIFLSTEQDLIAAQAGCEH